MREPAYWWRPASWQSLLLAPLGSIYGSVAAHRLQGCGRDVGLPVICVGNYHLGGAGKTPTVMALVRLLADGGERPFVLSRGYGGSQRGPIRVDPERHAAFDVGDEPLLLAAVAPVVVSRDRVAGAQLARAEGASVIVMDDGFQNPSLHKHLTLIVVDGARGIGNGAVFPAGPLRAPLAPQIERTGALVIVGQGGAAQGLAAAVAARGGLVLRARLQANPSSVAALQGRRVLAFAGIGDPARFFDTLRTNGIDVAASRSFPDHHIYSDTAIAALRAEAERAQLALVTTEKDLVRLRARGSGRSTDSIEGFAVTLAFEDEKQLRQRVLQTIVAARHTPPGAAS